MEGTEPQTLVAPIWLIITLLGPLYGLVGGLYVLLFKHSNNKDCHFDADACTESKQLIRGYIRDVDTRSAEALKELKDDINKQFDRLFKELSR